MWFVGSPVARFESVASVDVVVTDWVSSVTSPNCGRIANLKVPVAPIVDLRRMIEPAGVKVLVKVHTPPWSVP